jgi:hypothetical protein
VLLVAGGGGASLDSAPAGFQWQPDSWRQPFYESEYSQVKLAVTAAKITVEVRGTESISTDFKVIDSFSIPLSAVGAK